ncbi:MAG: DNA-binding protein [Microbacteriaceae bacterium]|nr:DNA-binding protein [Microbacteriaceae bacterium]
MSDTDLPYIHGSPVGRFLTIGDTAEILNISAGQAYALVRSGELPAIKIGSGGQWRVEHDVLEAYISGKYEEARRHALWNQAEFASLEEYSFGSRSSHAQQ